MICSSSAALTCAWLERSAVSTKPRPVFHRDVATFHDHGAAALEVQNVGSPGVPAVVLRRNTLRHMGASAGILVSGRSVLVELNELADQHDLQNDGSLLQLSGGAEQSDPPELGVRVRRNWLHDALASRSSKWGIRIDRVDNRCVSGGGDAEEAPPLQPGGKRIRQSFWQAHASLVENVVWSCNGLMVKGNRHLVERNTVFGTLARGRCSPPSAAFRPCRKSAIGRLLLRDSAHVLRMSSS